jgi:alanine racemase
LALLLTDNVPSVGLLSIDLEAVVANWQLLQQRIKVSSPAAECAAVVKANAYGLGVRPISSALWLGGCRFFFVATLAEAIELRECLGDDAQIAVLGGLSHGLGDDWLRYGLVPVLFSVEYVHQWLDYCRLCGNALPCILKVDTGMHRLGLSLNDVDDLCISAVSKTLLPLLLMSHLACADEPEHLLNQHQLAEFLLATQKLRQVFPAMRYSLANSSGLFLDSSFAFDIGRPGAALYGINPTPRLVNPMRPVVRLQLPILQLKTIQLGESVGYGATFIARRATRLAVVFGGYADGLLRALSNSGFAYLAGQKVPVVGRVSMDSMVFDVTDVREASLAVKYIDVFGVDQSIDDLAALAGTIGYELLTSLGARYQRCYINSHDKEAL